jgi:hypothetical protein
VSPLTIAADQSSGREPFLQRCERAACAPFLNEAQCGVEQQQSADDRGLNIGSQRDLKNDRGFKHPRNRRPEFCKEFLPARRHLFADGVRADSSKSAARFAARQADRGQGTHRAFVDADCRCLCHVMP